MTYPTVTAINVFNRVFNLPATGREQDWDIELADPDRVSEFAAYLEHHELSLAEKQTLMALILGSLEDLAQRGEVPREILNTVNRLLKANRAGYSDLIDRWCSRGSGDDRFAISEIIDAVRIGK